MTTNGQPTQPAGVLIMSQPAPAPFMAQPAPAPPMAPAVPVGQQPGNFEYYAPNPYSNQYYAPPAPPAESHPQMMPNGHPPPPGHMQYPNDPNKALGASAAAGAGAGLCAACLALCACCSLANCLF